VDGWEALPTAALATRLNELRVPTPSGAGEWTYQKAQRARERARA
jgi:hypothetical protein